MTQSPSTHPSLLQRALVDSPDAWSQLCALYRPLLFAWGKRLGCNQEECEDLSQDVFANAYRNLGQFNGTGKSGSFRGWLWRITYRKWIDRYRSTKGHAIATGGSTAFHRLQDVADPQEMNPPQDPSSMEEVTNIVHNAMRVIQQEFRADHWQAFWMTAVQGITTEEIAAKLQMSPANVRQARSRILRRLRIALGDLPSSRLDS